MATFTVTTSADDGAGSLRAAVSAANASAGADVIEFDAAVFDGGPEDLIRLTSGQIEIADELTIMGGPSGVTITGDAAGDDVTLDGITDIDASGAARLDDNSRIFDATADLTIEGLTLTGGHAAGQGGALRSSAKVTLQTSIISGNGTTEDSEGGTEADGGGVHTSGALSVQDSTISGNRAEGSGGGVSGKTVHVTNSVLNDNRTGFEHAGGGVFGLRVTVENSTVFDNHAGQGGGIHQWFNSGANPESIRVSNSVVRDNTAQYGGGGIRAYDDIQVSDSLVSGNDGGGESGEGGGIHGGTVTILRSTVSDNKGNGYGGGVYSGSTVLLENSTISGNSVSAGFDGANGGGVFSAGAVTVIQSTVSGNLADVGDTGGGGGGILAKAVALENSIVLGNVAGTAADEVQGARTLTGGNILGPDILDGAAVIGSTTAAGVFAATTEIVPGVFAGVLADNGRPVPTIAIRQDGSAAGAADPATALDADQRGFSRDAAPDLGAFEAGAERALHIIGGPKADVLVGWEGEDRFWGRGGDDLLRGLGGDDLLRGDEGEDQLEGGAGDDLLHGGADCDRIDGGDGDDVILGGQGDDRIKGGAGDDTLHGGAGGDVFVFGQGFGNDEIHDFNASPQGGQDRLDLHRLGISAASFAGTVSIEQVGDDTRVIVGEHGSILLVGVEDAPPIGQTDFLLA